MIEYTYSTAESFHLFHRADFLQHICTYKSLRKDQITEINTKIRKSKKNMRIAQKTDEEFTFRSRAFERC